MDEQVVALLRQMFVAYNQPCSPERLAMYVEVLGSPDPEALREAIRDAMKESDNFAPGPGSVSKALRAVTRSRPGDPVNDWTFAGQRGLPPGEAIGKLMSGVERRVVGMDAIFARAREIQAAHLVPPDLWGRFAAQVMAELEMDPCAEVSEEMRRCMAHAKAWREANGREWEAA